MVINARYTLLLVLLTFTAPSLANNSAPTTEPWYVGDERCPPPKNDGTYSAPYKASDHPTEYPTFDGADKPGWSCSYQRADGVTVQYGDSRTPQEQWIALFGRGNDGND